MRREELEHVLRASAAITTDTSFVVIGSQSVLLPHPDAPPELLLSNVAWARRRAVEAAP